MNSFITLSGVRKPCPTVLGRGVSPVTVSTTGSVLGERLTIVLFDNTLTDADDVMACSSRIAAARASDLTRSS